MKKETYTPGPWRYEESTKTIRSVPENYWLATMDSFDGAVNHQANAALIAAAPEMAEALRWLLREAENYMDAEHNQEVFNNARAALAKAGVQ